MLAKIYAAARIPEWDHASANAVLLGLTHGGYFRMSLVDDAWQYRKSEQLPRSPTAADNGPGSEAFNARLRRAHEQNRLASTVRWPLTTRPTPAMSASNS